MPVDTRKIKCKFEKQAAELENRIWVHGYNSNSVPEDKTKMIILQSLAFIIRELKPNKSKAEKS